MSRTSKTLRRLSVPVLVGSVIMTGVSGLGFAGVANAAPTPGTLVLTIANTDGSSGIYGTTAANNATPADTFTANATYTSGTDPVSVAAGANPQTLTFTLTGSAVFTNGPGSGTNQTTCVTTGGTGTSCTTVPTFYDPKSEVVTVTVSDTKTLLTPNNDPTTTAVQGTAHIAGLHFNDCSSLGFNTNANPATAPDNFCGVQVQVGSQKTQTLTYLQDGVAKSGVTVSIVLGSANGSFTATQPANVVAAGTNAVCTTDAAGQCTITYIDNTAENNNTIIASTSNDGLFPASYAVENIDFIASATPGRIEQISRTTIKPSTSAFGTRKPGVVQEVQYRLFSTCTTLAGDATCTGTPLVNRAVTLSVNHGFFTRNCSLTGVGGSGDYANCTFNPAPAAGSQVGNIASLGTTMSVTTDGSGYFYASFGIARDAGFDDDGEVLATVTGVAAGSTATLTANNPGDGAAGQNCTTSPNNGGCIKQIEWNTSNSPLNGGAISFVAIDGNDISGNPNNVPNVATRVYVVHVLDQFGNLTDANDNVDVSWTGAGYLYHCGFPGATTCSRGTPSGNPFSVYGSYTNADEQDRIVSSADQVLNDATPAETGLQTVTADYAAPHTVFNTFSPASAGVPAAATYTADTVAKTASLKFNFYDQAAQPVVTFSTTPSNTVSDGTVVTVSATVKDQFGFPIAGYPVDFFVNGTNVSSCNPLHNPAPIATNSAGKAGFSFGCNNPGTVAVTIVVADGSGNEIARGVQNVTFTAGPPPGTTGDPSFSLNVHTIGIGQCAVLTVSGTAGQTITVFVKGAGAAGFTALNSMQPTQHMRVCPGTNSTYKVSSSKGTSAAQTLLVKAIETLVVSRAGQSANFAGHVIPGVVGRKVQVFFYVDGGHVEDGGVGAVRPGGNFSFSHAVNHPGKVVHFFAQTFADGFNTSGRSRLVSAQF